jgi:thymidylate synthase ThyX
LKFLSAEPIVRLTKAFSTPYRNVVATARTCYSSRGIVDDAQVGEPDKFTPLVQSIYEAGHHTTFQHAHFQFSLENVSRQFIWSFLHAHPFYNSEQVSQRYVAVRPDTVVVPDLPADQAAVYRAVVDHQFEAYRHLCGLLEAPARSEFFKRFNQSERMAKRHDAAIRKKAQEAARYVLPLATHAYLYHTISGITLLRYYRMLNQLDVPAEQRLVVERMVQCLLEFDPEYRITLEEPLGPDDLPEAAFHAAHGGVMDPARAGRFRAEFDGDLGSYTSRLLSWPSRGMEVLADSVREVLGFPRDMLSDEDAVALVLDPSRNTLLGESLNLTTMSKLGRCLSHVHFTFRKRLSHAADSQDQRHRMTPGSRPFLASHLDGEPDYTVPGVVAVDDRARAYYGAVMEKTWEGINRLRQLGASPEVLLYLLPNAVNVRFTESADLLNLRHKHVMRLCYNAQEEIWRASVEEATQIRGVLPGLGRFLLPPCGVRALARRKPICPEGPRYCGVRVWKLDISDYERVI